MNLVHITLLLTVQFSLQDEVKIDHQTRIHMGQIAKRHSAPYQVALWITSKNLDHSFCGGSLITNTFVLTAGHCLYNTAKVTAIVGAHSIENPKDFDVMVDTKKFIIHKQFNPSTGANDIGLVELPDPVKFTKFIEIIKLPKKSDDITLTGKYGKLTGWGVTSNASNKQSKILKELRVRIVGKKECVGVKLTPNNICGFGELNGTACLGDSGSPLVLEKTNIQIGIVSFGHEKGCTMGVPHVYTKVWPYLNWIERYSNYKNV